MARQYTPEERQAALHLVAERGQAAAAASTHPIIITISNSPRHRRRTRLSPSTKPHSRPFYLCNRL